MEVPEVPEADEVLCGGPLGPLLGLLGGPGLLEGEGCPDLGFSATEVIF